MVRRKRSDGPYVAPHHPTDEERRANLARPSFRSFDEYVEAFPEAAAFRDLYTSGTLAWRFFPAEPAGFGCLPGCYTAACVLFRPRLTHPHVVLHDGDDGHMVQVFRTLTRAGEALDELELLAPFSWSDLTLFGYAYE